MREIFTSLGLMSGSSGDGIDSSLIRSDGDKTCEIIKNQYIPYPKNIVNDYYFLRDKILRKIDIEHNKQEIKKFEEKITNFHKLISANWLNKFDIDLIGFHGQTLYHNSDEGISLQIGNGLKLSQDLKTTVVFNFRQNDILNGGEGAPLTPIYHKLLIDKIEEVKKIDKPITILNLGGIANITIIKQKHELFSKDIGPGNCLIDNWVRLNSNKSYDENGEIASSGKIDKFILNQTLDNYLNNSVSKKKSLDLNDFNINFARGLSLKDGAATITKFTTEILSKHLSGKKILVCGGGRKNKFLIKLLKEKNANIENIDTFNFNGDFIESQAFAFLAIRSLLKLPITFPTTTGCSKPSTGGQVVKNI